ncbi:MAG: hypothetical protein RLZZ214_3626 [Verrucomicrobiota bacterium]
MWAITAMTLVAGNFAAPAEGPVAFRRDRLPLDADTMTTLSRQLVTLAQGLDAATAIKRRAAAQMLALATALDPGNGKAREVLAGYQKGRHPSAPDVGQLEKTRERVWQDIAWLETAEAGGEGQALAAGLTDVLVVSDPQNSKAQSLAAAGERGAWQGWIPALAAYEPTAVAEATPADGPVIEKNPATTSEILLRRAQISTVIWKRVAKSGVVKWSQGTAPLQMVASKRPESEDGPQPFSINVGFSTENDGFREMNTMLLALLQKQYPTLPADVRVSIGSPGLMVPVEPPRRQSISAAAAVLAHAAISGREPDATILGVVDESGAYKLSVGFWSQLQALGSGNGGRLILPAAAAEYLPSMLALERPELFLEYEVLLAADLPELLRLSAKSPDEAREKAMAKFREIREKAPLQAIGQYVANIYVRKRLVEIVQEAPYHASAKMLAIQGAGNRPAFIPRMILAAELRRAIEPMEWLVKTSEEAFDFSEVGRLGTTGEVCRAQVDGLARYADKEGRILLGQVQDMIGGIRILERAARGRGEQGEVQAAILTAHATLIGAYQSVAAELAAATGEELPVSPP